MQKRFLKSKQPQHKCWGTQLLGRGLHPDPLSARVPPRPKGRGLPVLDNSGFTLLEVIIAMAIMAIAFSTILAVEGGAINASARAKQLNAAGMLAKNLMVETEYLMEGKAFNEVKKEEEGVFEQPYQDYRWKRIVKEIKFPRISPGGKSKDDSSNNQMSDMISKLITNFFSKAIREVSVTVFWKKGKGEQNFSLSTYWVDLNHEFQLNE